MSKLPHFLCLGAQKAGTTTLQEILFKNKEIFLNSKKELHFFDKDKNFKNGVEWYSSFFTEAS